MSVKDPISDLGISPHPLFGRASFTFSRAFVPSSDVPPLSSPFLRFPNSWDTSACTFRAFRRGNRILCVPLPYTLGTRDQLLRNSSNPASASLSDNYLTPTKLNTKKTNKKTARSTTRGESNHNCYWSHLHLVPYVFACPTSTFLVASAVDFSSSTED
ncbi:uncharacterized protein LOC121404779 [Drosophila obscura]|uniref:uncharacterized protein LOC121404779 n=1 Tax=Drosophila obscura TaxID=7282 RepID=UPI001BB1C4CD|nr:uncharacterized protein LOC121404779 [Drosophila obscura]